MKCLPSFKQIVFVQAKIGDKRPLPVAFVLLTQKVYFNFSFGACDLFEFFYFLRGASLKSNLSGYISLVMLLNPMCYVLQNFVIPRPPPPSLYTQIVFIILYFIQDKASYLKLLSIFKEYRALPPMGCEKTMSDFESGLLSALEESMPWATVFIFV